MADDFEFALAQMADEDRPLRSLSLTNLSDLSRAQLESFRAAWEGITPRRRLELIQVMVEQAEANIHLNFHAILRGLLADAEPQVRRLAIEGLWEDERPGLAPVLLALLAEDPNPDVRAIAASSLGRFVLLGALGEIEPSLSGEVEQALRAAWARPHEAVDVRRRALEGLAYSERSEDPQVRNLIETAYYDEDETMRQSAVFSMGRTADAQWASYIMAELGSVSASMRFEAAAAAGELRLVPAVRALVRLMDDPDGSVREAAALALGKIGGKEAQRALRLAARSEDARLAEVADEALEELAFDGGAADETGLMTYPRRPSERLTDDGDADYLPGSRRPAVAGWEAELDEEDDVEPDEDDLDSDDFEDEDEEADDGWDNDEDAEALIWGDDEEEEDEDLDDWDDDQES
jgi:hypothetical protein